MVKNKSGLVVFVRHAVAGKVKTRLAKDIGHDAALNIYHRLLQQTREAVRNVDADLFIYYSDFIPHDDLWAGIRCEKRIQRGADLGERMAFAISEVLETHKCVIIVGSDLPNPDSAVFSQAIAVLDHADVVVGPATDGGYYLIGMKSLHHALFTDMKWSMPDVFTKTRERLIDLHVDFHLLPLLRDVDTVEDLKAIGWTEYLI